MNKPSAHSYSFDRPATYKISVEGRIDLTWSDRLEGMSICMNKVDQGPSVTTLEGVLTDQAALVGVLTTLYELHLPVLSVKRLDNG
jgi:hypothetical protein